MSLFDGDFGLQPAFCWRLRRFRTHTLSAYVLLTLWSPDVKKCFFWLSAFKSSTLPYMAEHVAPSVAQQKITIDRIQAMETDAREIANLMYASYGAYDRRAIRAGEVLAAIQRMTWNLSRAVSRQGTPSPSNNGLIEESVGSAPFVPQAQHRRQQPGPCRPSFMERRVMCFPDGDIWAAFPDSLAR
jgi:hypothetical protein